MQRTAHLTTAARRWLAGALIAVTSAAMLLPGTAAAQEKHWGWGAPRHHAAPHPTTQHWDGHHHHARPQPGYGALWYGAHPAGGRTENHNGWHGAPHGHPQPHGLAWQAGGPAHLQQQGSGQPFIRRVR